ncbi:MAG: cytochrome c oxidase assembly protein [Micavibrio sp.]|nr:cytochrome c oxidase assembly protein [Micavibrio sp.]
MSQNNPDPPPTQKTKQPVPPSPTQQDLIRKNARTGLAVFAVFLFMVGLSFASVPLYNLFCRMTGFDGTTQTAAALPDHILDRTITIKFNASTGPHMMWDFKPELREIDVRLGEKGLAAFHAKNRSNTVTAGTAIYNVTPFKAGKYFHKIQCFCFDEQALQPGQDVSMPVMFFVDPALNDDPDMEDVKVITLSYTFYPVESKELEDALDAFYNEDAPAIQGTN